MATSTPDVAYACNERWERHKSADYFHGVPEIVIEVLSASNSAVEINDKERLCLESGVEEFWVVDPYLREVKVSTSVGRTVTYRMGQDIALPLFNQASLTVDALFAPLGN